MEANTTAMVQGTVQAKGAGASAVSATSRVSVTGSGSTGSSVGGHASFWGSIKASLGGHLSGMAKAGTLAVKGSLTAKTLVAVGVAVAGLTVAAHTGDVSTAQVAVQSVPTWTSGASLLGHIQAGLGGGASGGAGINLGL